MPTELPWLIWSNEHGRWWAPNRRGYTAMIGEAGRYPKEAAVEICHQANYGGRINEVAVLAPEAVDMIKAAIAQRERGEDIQIGL